MPELIASPPAKRLFLALPIPAPLKSTIKNIQKPWQSLDLPINWHAGRLLHLTLAFLGEQPVDRIDILTELMEKVGRQSARFRLQLEAPGAFPSFGHPQVLWMGVEPSMALIRLQRQLVQELESAGFTREIHPYHPHITIGRCPHELSRPDRQRVQAVLSKPPVVVGESGWEVDRMQLYESHYDEHGLHYTPLSGVMLP